MLSKSDSVFRHQASFNERLHLLTLTVVIYQINHVVHHHRHSSSRLHRYRHGRMVRRAKGEDPNVSEPGRVYLVRVAKGGRLQGFAIRKTRCDYWYGLS
jgi:hypothetical protein